MPCLFINLAIIFVALAIPQKSWAADCNLQEARSPSDPPGATISDEIRENNSLNNICSDGFPPGSDTIATFNTGTIIFNITRTDANQPLQYCEAAFDDIITQCIEGGNYWGGTWSLNGETYSIYDSEYPDYLLPSNLTTTTAANVPAGATTVTTVVSGITIIETFVPVTVTGKSSTTSTTTIDGVAFPIIIGAGGLAFIPFIPPGGPIPVPITPPGAPNDGPRSNPTTTISHTSSTTTSSHALTISPIEEYYGGGPGTFNSEIATQTTTYGTSTRTTPPAQTVTTNCQVCVLPFGSVDPACNPIPGCVLTTVTPTTTSAAPASTWPGCGTLSVDGFTCGNNCRGYVPCPAWCADMCAYCFNANNVC